MVVIIATMFQQPLPKQCFGVNLAKAFTLSWLIPAVPKAVEQLHQKKDFKKQLRVTKFPFQKAAVIQKDSR